MNISARCTCGNIKFTSTSEPVLALCCHCLDCQDALQADFAHIAFFKIDETAIEGDLKEKHYTAASGNKTRRQYCSDCGTVMFDRSEGFPGLLGVMARHVQPAELANPSCHIFLRDKKTTVRVPAGMKQYEMGLS